MKYFHTFQIFIFISTSLTLNVALKKSENDISNRIINGQDNNQDNSDYVIRIVASVDNNAIGHLKTGVAISPRRVLTVAQGIIK